MAIKKAYSQAARVQGILRTLGARHGITIGELAEEFGPKVELVFPKSLRDEIEANLSKASVHYSKSFPLRKRTPYLLKE
jgi:hypothetical protein